MGLHAAAQREVLITTPYFVPDTMVLATRCTAAWRGGDQRHPCPPERLLRQSTPITMSQVLTWPRRGRGYRGCDPAGASFKINKKCLCCNPSALQKLLHP